MKEYISVLKKAPIFAGVSDAGVESMLSCLAAKAKSYKKGEYVLCQGDDAGQIAVLVKGLLHIQRDDYWGNRSIVSTVDEGEMFGESYAVPGGGKALNDVVAVENSTVIFFDTQKLLTVCSSACRFHSLVVQNLFYAISEKNRRLVQKLGHISKRTIREKLISYLSEAANRQNSNEITIPFNRQQLADFLSVDRSAISAELCRMRDEGLLEFRKNWFRLLS